MAVVVDRVVVRNREQHQGAERRVKSERSACAHDPHEPRHTNRCEQCGAASSAFCVVEHGKAYTHASRVTVTRAPPLYQPVAFCTCSDAMCIYRV